MYGIGTFELVVAALGACCLGGFIALVTVVILAAWKK